MSIVQNHLDKVPSLEMSATLILIRWPDRKTDAMGKASCQSI